MKNKLLLSISALSLVGMTLFSVPSAFAQGKTHTHTKTGLSITARLAQEVTSGKITAAQEQLILSELNTLKADKTNLKGMTKAQRKAFFQTDKTKLLSWAKQNGINPAYIPGWYTHAKGK